MSISTPNYRTMESVSFFYSSRGGSGVLDAGVFVRPIEFRYLPKEIQNDDRAVSFYSKDKDVFVYCHCGIVLIPKKSIEKV